MELVKYLERYHIDYDCDSLDFPIIFVKSKQTARNIASKFGYKVFDIEYDRSGKDYIVTLERN